MLRNSCCICLERISSAEKWQCTTCKARVHTHCVRTWASYQSGALSCPVCKETQSNDLVSNGVNSAAQPQQCVVGKGTVEFENLLYNKIWKSGVGAKRFVVVPIRRGVSYSRICALMPYILETTGVSSYKVHKRRLYLYFSPPPSLLHTADVSS